MESRKINVLITKEADERMLELAAKNGLELIEQPMIQIHAILNKKKLGDYLKNNVADAWVFTSGNAVKAVAAFKKKMKDAFSGQHIYAVGERTASLIRDYLGLDAKMPEQTDAKGLASLILQNKNVKSVLFFCGNRRRDELPDELKNNGVAVHEAIVYETAMVPQAVNIDGANAVMFTSPVAVESYFAANPIWESVVYFALGNTTASTLRNFVDETAMQIASTPDLDVLFQEIKKYFSAHATQK